MPATHVYRCNVQRPDSGSRSPPVTLGLGSKTLASVDRGSSVVEHPGGKLVFSSMFIVNRARPLPAGPGPVAWPLAMRGAAASGSGGRAIAKTA